MTRRLPKNGAVSSGGRHAPLCRPSLYQICLVSSCPGHSHHRYALDVVAAARRFAQVAAGRIQLAGARVGRRRLTTWGGWSLPLGRVKPDLARQCRGPMPHCLRHRDKPGFPVFLLDKIRASGWVEAAWMDTLHAFPKWRQCGHVTATERVGGGSMSLVTSRYQARPSTQQLPARASNALGTLYGGRVCTPDIPNACRSHARGEVRRLTHSLRNPARLAGRRLRVPSKRGVGCRQFRQLTPYFIQFPPGKARAAWKDTPRTARPGTIVVRSRRHCQKPRSRHQARPLANSHGVS